MNDELSRHKEALKVAIGALRELGLDFAQVTAMVEKRVAAVLEPPEEFLEVDVVRWECADCGYIHAHIVMPTECESGLNCNQGFFKLAGTVKRPVRRAVIREYEVAVKVDSCGDVRGIGGRPFADHPECHGNAGVLIFRTAE